MTALTRPDAEFRVAALKWLADYTRAQYDKARDELALTMRRGAKLPAWSPLDDRQLGQASMSNPTHQLLITDEAELVAWYALHYPDHVEHTEQITGPEAEVLATLVRHAPHLVTVLPRLRKWALEELRTVSVGMGHVSGPGGEMDVPGVQVERPNPRLTVTTSKDADEIMRDLVSRNAITVDGHLREIEA